MYYIQAVGEATNHKTIKKAKSETERLKLWKMVQCTTRRGIINELKDKRKFISGIKSTNHKNYAPEPEVIKRKL